MTAAALGIRAPTLDDVPAITAMMNARGEALHGAPEMSEAELRGWFTLPSLDIERDIRVAVGADGAIVGYVDLVQAEDGSRLWVDLRVDLVRGSAALESLLDEIEARAREKAVPGAVVRGVADEGDAPYRRLLDARGYRLVRSSYRMLIDFEGAPPAPNAPVGLEIRPYRRGEEERAAYDVVQDAFAEAWDHTSQPYEEFLHWWSKDDTDSSLLWAAADADALVGVCLCRPDAQGDAARGWVEALGVRRPWRGRGLGRALLLTAFGEFHRRGQAGAGLTVDAENLTGALRLYESVGMRVARRFDIYDRPLDG